MGLRRLIQVIIAVLMIGTSLVSCDNTVVSDNDPEVSLSASELGEKIKYIVHGAGKLSGVNLYGESKFFNVSNSAEGLKQCKEAGIDFIELDFNYTSDGRIVCIHDWFPSYSDDIEYEGDKLSYDEFVKTKIYRQYTPVTLENVMEYLEENENVYIITDFKNDNVAGLEYIASHYPGKLSRFIAQIYSEDEYDKVVKLGYKYIIYTLYRLSWAEKTDYDHLKAFAEEHELVGLTFSYELCDVEGFMNGIKDAGTALFVHTVDDPELQKKYFDMGITGLYTNEVIK